jgi:hypothetical protein
MSSDFLEDVEDSEGNVVHLAISPLSGFAKLTILQHDDLVFIKSIATNGIKIEGDIVSFHLLPDETGWKNAAKIADALNNWIQNTKER